MPASRTVICTVFVCLVGVALVGGLSETTGAKATTETPNETGNDTVQHEHPDSVAESGDLRQLQRWLGGRLGDRLRSSTIALSQGQYEQAKALLGEDYDGRLAQYVDVAGETGEGEAAGDTYDDVQAGQRTLVTQLQRFQQARERYRTARENGDTSEAREAAREMNRLADRIEASGVNVTRGYERLENQTGAETEAEQATIRNVTADVTEAAAEARQTTFVETNLSVIAATRTISFVDPLNVTARLSIANGSALSNQTVTVTLAGQSRSVTTDADGRFELTYRPRTLRLNVSAIRLAYVPRNESVYFASNASIPVDVEQVTPTVTVRNATTETSYGEPAGADAVVTVDGDPVEGVPVAATLAGARLDVATTNRSGHARVASGLPAGIDTGNHSLHVAVDLSNRAIGTANDSTTVDVRSTPTNMSVDGTGRNGKASISGRLTTADDRPVGPQTVRITRNGTTVSTVRAGPNGSFSTTIPIDNQRAGGAVTVQIGVRFDGSGTNLESSRATTSIRVQSESGGSDGELGDSLGGLSDLQNQFFGDIGWPLVATVAVFLLSAAIILTWHRRADEEDGEPEPFGEHADASTESGASGSTEETGVVGPLDRAAGFLDAGAANAAVRVAYAGVRERYLGSDASGTHWELLERVQSLTDDERSALERIVQTYERAAFSPTSIEHDDAQAVIDAARTVLDSDEPELADD